jgi:murein DD-endopeptidase MepM/ murein hydrolase activator NlpD
MSAYPPLRPDATYDLGFVLTQPFHAGPVSYNPSPHLAIDAAGYGGQPVRAVECGVVFSSAWNGDGWAIGGGNVVIVDHVSRDGKRYRSSYAHLKSRAVAKGAIVARGQIIGYADSTGNSSGHHLHLGIGQFQGIARDGGYNYLDPFRFFLALRYENGAHATGDLADNFQASQYVNAAVNARSGPSTSYPIVYSTRAREVWGYRGATNGQQPPGFGNRIWHRVWIPAARKLAWRHSQLGTWVA